MIRNFSKREWTTLVISVACATLMLGFARAESPNAAAVVSAASFEPRVAYGSLASIFGTNLANEPAVATLDASGSLPTSLGGTVVEINGQPAPLVYVSYNQVNLFIPADVPAGSASFIVRTSQGASEPLAASIETVAPGVFLLACLRADRGAIRNGVTFGLEPFHARTEENAGQDKRTRLSIFGTGLRFAGGGNRNGGVNVADFVKVEVIDLTERVVPLEIEYAGPAPNFFGLDQINAVLPRELEGIGPLKLRITADEEVSNLVSVVLTPESLPIGMDKRFTVQGLAGNGQSGLAGDGGQAVLALLQTPLGVALDRHQNLYIADGDNHVVRRVTLNGTISLFAGSGEAGTSGDGGPATQARLQRPTAVAVDERGGLYIADSTAHNVRRVSTTGIITTFAGTGVPGADGDGGLATQARLGSPVAVTVSRYNSVLITDRDNHSIRKVTGDGLIQTVAGSGEAGFDGDGASADAAKLNSPSCLATLPDNTVYFADSLNYRIRRVSPDGIMTTIAGTGTNGAARDGVAASVAEFANPTGIAMTHSGEVVVSDSGDDLIRVIDSNCQMRTIAGTGSRGFSGDGGSALQAQLNSPSGVAVDPFGDVYVADSGNNRVRKLWRPLGETCGEAAAIAFDPPVVVEGQTVTAYVRLSCPAAANTTVALTSGETIVSGSASLTAALGQARLQAGPVAGLIPGSITVPAGQTTTTFSIKTPVTSQTTFVEVSGSAGATQTAGAFTVVAGIGSTPEIVALRLSSDSVTGGVPITGLVRLGRPAPLGGLAVFLSVNDAAAGLMQSVTVPEGEVYVEFLVRTGVVDAPTHVTVTGSTNAASQNGDFIVLPPNGTNDPVLGTLLSLSVSPNSVPGGDSAIGTVTLGAPAAASGVLVNLTSNSGSVAVPASIVVPAGARSAQFSVSTEVVDEATLAVLGAASANSVSTTLIVTSGDGGPQPGTISSLALNPTSVDGGQASTGTVTLSEPAAQGGVLVGLSSNSASATTPASVVIPAGATARDFTVNTSTVASTMVAQISANSANSTSASLTINSGGGSGDGTLASLSLSPHAVTGLLEDSTGTITLAEAAPAGGVIVALSSNNTAATVPASVTVPTGQMSATFAVTSNLVLTQQQALITGTADNSVSDTLTVNPPLPVDGAIASFTISPNSVTGGAPATGTITLSQAAPVGGVQIDLSSNSIAAVVPSTALVIAGSISTTVPITTTPVLATTLANITATSGNSVAASLTVEPIAVSTPTTGPLASLDINPSSVTGLLQSATGVVSLPAAAPSQGVSVTLASDNPAAVVPATITVPGGATSQTFTITTTLVLTATSVTITATSDNSVTDTLTVEPPLPTDDATIASLSFSPSTVTGGVPTTGTVTLTAPAPVGGVTVDLSSSGLAAVVSPTVLVPAGSTSVDFPVTTTVVLTVTMPTITASANNSVNQTITVNPIL